MLYHDLNAAEAIMDLRVEERLRQAETRHLLRQVKDERTAWLPRHSARLLYGLGQALVALGQRLQCRACAPAMLPERGEVARS